MSTERSRLIEELYQRYGKRSETQQRWLYLRKKYVWLLIIGSSRLLKRCFDIVAALILSVLCTPIFIVTALLIKLSDGGDIFYFSKRVGKWGKEFDCPKFRTMIPNADSQKAHISHLNEHQEGHTFKSKKDPRVTSVGRFLRKSSIDELPQIWCVLKGEMSFVGPRPPLPSEVAKYSIKERQRLDIRPGITCIWQISGRAELPFQKQLKLDKEYIENRSFCLDLLILIKTIPAVISGRGAY